MQETRPNTIYLREYQVPVFLVDHVDLQFMLRETGSRVRSRLHIRRNPEAVDANAPLLLDGEGLTPIHLAINDQTLAEDAWTYDGEKLTLHSPGDHFILSAEVEITPEDNTALEGLYRSNALFCTQCEAEGFRKITWFPDRPDVMSTFRVRIEADKSRYPVLLSNGNPGATGDLDNGQHFAEWDDPTPKPCYLFALVAGDLQFIQDKHVTPSGRSVDLRIYTEPENIRQCDHAMRALQNAMRWDEEKYGREYDLDVYNIVAVNDFNMGAMENKGLNIFNARFVLASPETATDQDFQNIEGVIAHEYFHNWTGNRITCRDWFQLSLKEGLTVYRDQEFSADQGSRSVKRIEDVRLLRTHQFAEDASPMAHPVRPDAYMEINNFYTVTVYEKGAEVVRMQANLLGPDLYRKATDLYFSRHDGQAVTIEDFIACMADASGRDLRQFKHWYDYAGTPKLTVRDQYDAETQRYILTIQQHTPDTPQQTDKPPMHIPFALGLVGADGQDLTPPNTLLELTERQHDFVFDAIPERPTPSLLRGFSAPVSVDYPYTDVQLMHLMAYDSDGFNRWDAAQTLLGQTILSMTAGESMPDGLMQVLSATLSAESTEAALIAEVLTLPDLGYLSDCMAVADVDALHQARERLRRSIADNLSELMLTHYQQLAKTDTNDLTATAIGQRRLKNRLLWYLAALERADIQQLVIEQYQAQSNMTDVIAALTLLADSDDPAREQALDDFAQRWRHAPLVMDKWFQVQATSQRESVLVEIQQLMQHPAFSRQNPNKVRALIGAFANANPRRFHAADGSGYRFISEQVRELDATNPQIAARLLRSLSRWRRYDADRQQQMREALQYILAANVSKDVYEIAAKSLEVS